MKEGAPRTTPCCSPCGRGRRPSEYASLHEPRSERTERTGAMGGMGPTINVLYIQPSRNNGSDLARNYILYLIFSYTVFCEPLRIALNNSETPSGLLRASP